jgi:hypothetical protein
MDNKAVINSFKSILWTRHARFKMNYYKLSEARVKKVLHSPKRIEEGVALKTMAAMQPSSIKYLKNDNKKSSSEKNIRSEIWSQEIWVMFQDLKEKRVIISAWRFPGMSKQKNSSSIINKMKEEYDSFIKDLKSDSAS